MSSLQFSVIMPTFNRADVVGKTIDAYCSQSTDVNGLEVIVVDDGSSDSTLSILEQMRVRYPNTVRIVKQENRGPAAARNRGIQEAQGEFLLFGGDDVIPTSGFLAAHRRSHEEHPDPKVAVLGKITWSPEFPVTRFMRWLESGGMQFHYGSAADPSRLPPTMFYSSNVSLKRTFLTEGELFDERFSAAAWEDTDLGMRLAARGLRLLLCEDALGHHVHKTDFRRFARRTETAGYFHAMLIEKHGLIEKRKTPIREAIKYLAGTVLRTIGVGAARELGYRWSLSWHEFRGMRRYDREGVNA